VKPTSGYNTFDIAVFLFEKRYLFIWGLPAIENDYNVDEIIIFYTIQYFV